MPITRGAQKAHRSSLRKKVFNMRRKNEMNDVVKKVKKLVAGKEVKEALALMPTAYQAIDKAEKRGVIKQNTASRKKSRLSALVKKAS